MLSVKKPQNLQLLTLLSCQQFLVLSHLQLRNPIKVLKMKVSRLVILKSKNVIFLVGDGMGPSFNTAYRYYKMIRMLKK